MLRTPLRIGLVLLFAGFTACTKDGGEHADNGPKGNACSDDVEKFCGDVQKGEGRVIHCLEKHDAELSPGCQALQKKRLVKLKENEERQARKAAAKAAVTGLPPPAVCTADKPCKDEPAKTAVVSSAEDPKKMAKGDKPAEPSKAKKK